MVRHRDDARCKLHFLSFGRKVHKSTDAKALPTANCSHSEGDDDDDDDDEHGGDARSTKVNCLKNELNVVNLPVELLARMVDAPPVPTFQHGRRSVDPNENNFKLAL